MNDTTERSEPPDQPVPPPAGTGSGSARCHWCGYSLKGLADRGNCPECGKSYSPETVTRLQPWPSALKICLRLGWPIIGLAVSILLFGSGALVCGYPFLVAVPINSYYQVRSLLRRSLPERTRTVGIVAVLRAVGTTVCVIGLLAFLAPFLFFAGCLIYLSVNPDAFSGS
ncbi:MAG: hypothetical protein IIB53_01730 [Planctomycetes bacterium]|nr:hypothetical protein [Planctomycetota bacterium]MCH8260236.1 hypothetical protein [Planctomycetota bacterium]